MVMIVGRPLFRRWAELVGEPDWIDDPRFADDQSRGDNGAILSKRMAEWCSQRRTDEALAELEEARVPAGPILTPQEALDDRHVREVGFLKHMDYPGLPNRAAVADTMVKLSETPGGIRRRPPTLGEHTDQILAELGYSKKDIAELREKRVV